VVGDLASKERMEVGEILGPGRVQLVGVGTRIIGNYRSRVVFFGLVDCGGCWPTRSYPQEPLSPPVDLTAEYNESATTTLGYIRICELASAASLNDHTIICWDSLVRPWKRAVQ
jgi:hypothetical protein